MILVTGGAGFIGANFVLHWLAHSDEPVVNLDALTYSGNLGSLAAVQCDARHVFVYGDICDAALVGQLLATYRPRAVVHLAAESHVDRSILGPEAFLRTNIEGTSCLLQAAQKFWDGLPTDEKAAFRFLHVSTDEVYGTLESDDPPFTEGTTFRPNGAYAASKAASNHLVRAWFQTYGLPMLTTNCSNNYGPLQFPEKLIPLTLLNALAGRPLPLYGDGLNVRDWLYVRDHCAALRRVLEAGQVGETYNIGGWTERTNLEIVEALCRMLDELHPDPGGSHERLITFVHDRPGHDRRSAIDAQRIERELGWRPLETLETGLRKTVRWYLDHPEWVAQVQRHVSGMN
ncbi:dTDP-glucose 4,6-dehydratase [Emcibacter sp. SYSU 3D8]